jgi:hypothetical protein
MRTLLLVDAQTVRRSPNCFFCNVTFVYLVAEVLHSVSYYNQCHGINSRDRMVYVSYQIMHYRSIHGRHRFPMATCHFRPLVKSYNMNIVYNNVVLTNQHETVQELFTL